MPKIRQVFKESQTVSIKSIPNKIVAKAIDDNGWVQWGLRLISEGRLVDAVKCFDHAIEQNEFNSEAYFYKGKCLIRLNRGEEGIECFDKTFQLKSGEMLIKDDITPIYNPELKSKTSRLDIDYPNNTQLENSPESMEVTPTKPKYGRYLENFHTDDLANPFMDNRDFVNNASKTNHGTFDLSSHKYKILTYESNLLPRDGAFEIGENKFVEQLLIYQQAEIDHVIKYLIEQNGGCFYYLVDPKYLFRISMLLLQMIIDDYNMDGVVVSIDKPAKNIQKIINRMCKSTHQPFYIDCDMGALYSNNPDIQVASESISYTEPAKIGNITHIGNDFNFSDLRDTIEMTVQDVAEEYEGEHYFIFFDNIATFQNYISENEIKKFIFKFADDLEKLNMYGFFMVPKGTFNISLIDSLRNISSSLSNKLSEVLKLKR